MRLRFQTIHRSTATLLFPILAFSFLSPPSPMPHRFEIVIGNVVGST